MVPRPNLLEIWSGVSQATRTRDEGGMGGELGGSRRGVLVRRQLLLSLSLPVLSINTVKGVGKGEKENR